MALKHYGGSTPAQATEWDCPSCHATNTVPLKAGCQTCGAGGDARKVEAKSGLHPETQKFVAEALAEEALLPVQRGFNLWLAAMRPMDTSHNTIAEAAFMAGVAWAQAQTYEQAVAPARAALDTLTEKGFPVNLGEGYESQHSTLWIEHSPGGTEPLAPAVLLTILAALAFYRDNVLNYNTVDGQLDGPAVTALVERLLPKEPEA